MSLPPLSLEGLGLEDERFPEKELIKPWLRERLWTLRRINVVIERSDSIKIIFRCKNATKKEPSELRQLSRRPTTCPFKLRANYSLKSGLWSLVVINDHHDHDVQLDSKKKSDDDDEDDDDDAEKEDIPDTYVADTPEIPKSAVTTPASDVFNLINTTDTTTTPSYESPVATEPDFKLLGFTTPAKVRKRRLFSENRLRYPTPRADKTATLFSSPDTIARYLRKEVNLLVMQHILTNPALGREDRISLMDSFSSQFILDHRDTLSYKFVDELYESKVKQSRHHHRTTDDMHHQHQKNRISNWFTNPTTSSTNLIPLSPLLNDSDSEMNGASNNTMENFTQLPGINIGSNGLTNFTSTFFAPNQGLQIQNQNQQLPSFNSIQNQLPLSPGNTVGSLIPPISNTSTTLNPSHLLKKSSSKNNLFNLSSSLLLNEYKPMTLQGTATRDPAGNSGTVSSLLNNMGNFDSGW